MSYFILTKSGNINVGWLCEILGVNVALLNKPFWKPIKMQYWDFKASRGTIYDRHVIRVRKRTGEMKICPYIKRYLGFIKLNWVVYYGFVEKKLDTVPSPKG
jgi:hypothetical protein